MDHRDRIGRNILRFSGLINGRALVPGLYTLSAQARVRAMGLLISPVNVRLRVRR